MGLYVDKDNYLCSTDGSLEIALSSVNDYAKRHIRKEKK